MSSWRADARHHWLRFEDPPVGVVHALLHDTVRLAWARKVPMFVVDVTPTVRAQIELVESYSLGG
jgi:hypothetical protein